MPDISRKACHACPSDDPMMLIGAGDVGSDPESRAAVDHMAVGALRAAQAGKPVDPQDAQQLFSRAQRWVCKVPQLWLMVSQPRHARDTDSCMHCVITIRCRCCWAVTFSKLCMHAGSQIKHHVSFFSLAASCDGVPPVCARRLQDIQRVLAAVMRPEQAANGNAPAAFTSLAAVSASADLAAASAIILAGTE